MVKEPDVPPHVLPVFLEGGAARKVEAFEQAVAVVVLQGERLRAVRGIARAVLGRRAGAFLEVGRKQLAADELFRLCRDAVDFARRSQEAVNVQYAVEDAVDGEVTVRHVCLESLVHFPSGDEDKVGLGGGKEELHVGDDGQHLPFPVLCGFRSAPVGRASLRVYLV